MEPPPTRSPRLSPTRVASRTTTARRMLIFPALSWGTVAESQPTEVDLGTGDRAGGDRNVVDSGFEGRGDRCLVPRHLRQGVGHHAGIAQCGIGKAGTDGGGEKTNRAGDGAGTDKTSHDQGTCDHADLTIHGPPLLPAHDITTGIGEGCGTTGEHTGGCQTGGRQPLAGLLRTDTGLADQDHTVLET